MKKSAYSKKDSQQAAFDNIDAPIVLKTLAPRNHLNHFNHRAAFTDFDNSDHIDHIENFDHFVYVDWTRE